MWEKGSVQHDGKYYHYTVKHYDEPSDMGINRGRVSKLSIWSTPTEADDRERRDFLCQYDRGWSIRPSTLVAKCLMAVLLEKYN